MPINSKGSPFKEEVTSIIKARMNFLNRFSFYFISFILFEFLFLSSSSFSSTEIPTSKEYGNQFPPLSLIGVIVSEDISSSVAILKNEKTGKAITLKIGESILDLMLTRVFENRIILRRGEKSFQIFLGRSNFTSASEKMQKNPREIKTNSQKDVNLRSNQFNNNLIRREFVRSEVERRVKREWPLIIKETRVAPNHIEGKISGFRITNLPKKSIISEIGIYKNDVIKEINGIELNDVTNLFWLYNALKVENRFEVCIERNGKLFRLLYILK